LTLPNNALAHAGGSDMTIAGLVTAYAVFLVSAIVYYRLTERRLDALSFEELLAKLDPVRTEGAVFFELQTECCNVDNGMRATQLWRIVGGREGLRRMEANARVLILLASLIESRLPDADQQFVQKLRGDGFLLKRAVHKIYLAMILRRTADWVVAPLLQAGTAYWSMVRRLLVVYDLYHAPLAPILRAACNVT